MISGCKNTVIPSSVTSIGGYAFKGCTGLTSIKIPPSVEFISEYAFEGCTGLATLIIDTLCSIFESIICGFDGAHGISVSEHAFYGCKRLRDVYCFAYEGEGILGISTYDAFDDSIEQATLHVPAITIHDYKDVEPWNKFKRIVAITEAEMNTRNTKWNYTHY